MLSRWRLVLSTAAVAIVLLSVAGCEGGGGGLARQYEYQEDIYLSLDGSATIVVNASLPALVALKGVDLPVDYRTRINREEVRRTFGSPYNDVTRVSRPWRRKGRRFIQVRIEVPDVAQLSRSDVFSDTAYLLTLQDGRTTLRGTIAGGAHEPVPEVRWDGSELVAFKLHLPSRIHSHNVRDLQTGETAGVERGNILRFEQRLTDRLAGTPVEMRVEMDDASILHRTLWLFAGAFGSAMLLLAGLIWWTVHRGRSRSVVGNRQSAFDERTPGPS
jgi:hypothetical protein